MSLLVEPFCRTRKIVFSLFFFFTITLPVNSIGLLLQPFKERNAHIQNILNTTVLVHVPDLLICAIAIYNWHFVSDPVDGKLW